MAKILDAIIVAILLCSAKCTDVCEQKSPCLCEFSEYSKIDISSATHNAKPQDFLQDEINGDTFYFHGCADGEFNLTAHGIVPKNVTDVLKGSLIRQVKTANGSRAEVLGYSNQIRFNPIKDEQGTYELIFRNGTNVTASVRLICDNFNQPFIKVLQNDSNVQKLALSSPEACIVTHHPGLSTGSVLLILFFIGIGIYFIGGGLILYFIRGARGFEMIPNIDFWKELPGLVKDGIIFIFSGCSATTITTPETYDKI